MEGQSGIYTEAEERKDFLDSFDLERFWYVIKRSKFWIIGLIFFSTASSYLYVRYTKPVYRSDSIVKLDFQSEANALGITNVINSQERSELPGEIALIKSRLFLSRIVEQSNLSVSYHIYGRYLTDERYKTSPFLVSFKVLNPVIYNRPIDIKITGSDAFTLTYTVNGEENLSTHRFGEEIKTPNVNLLIDKTPYLNQDLIGKRFFFTINSEESLIDYLQRNIQIIPENFDAKTIKISFSDYKAKKARDLVRLIDSLYLIYTREVKNQAIEQKIQFLNSQIEQTEEKLSEFEGYFEDFTIRNRTTDLGEDLNRTLSQLNRIDSQRFIIKTHLSDLEVIKHKVKELGAISIDPISADYLPAPLKNALAEYTEIQQERELKLASYNETSYIIKQLNFQIEKTEIMLEGLMDSYSNVLNKRLDEVDLKRQFFESNLYRLPSMGTQYSKKRRLYHLQEDQLLLLQTSKMELEITRAGTVTKNVVLSPASLPTTPIEPQKLLIMIAGFTAGLILSVIFLFIKYLMHNKISGLRELERIVKVPILGGIPAYRKKLEHTSLVTIKDSSSTISEALRTIRTNMDFIGGGNPSKLLSITSTVSGEGKTFVAVNLGAIIAMTGKKVVVVDIDMRKPKIHIAFGKENKVEGVSMILTRRSTIKKGLVKSSLNNLFFIPSGPTPPNPSELLLQKEFDEFLKNLKKEFDVVILDTPPVGLVTDGRIVMKKSDIQLYIVRADFSKRSFVKVMNDLHFTDQFKNMATILNSIDNTPVYGYGYGYGHGYGYYTEEKSKIKKMASSLRSIFLS
ncbi:MAG: polysaccharide biosynthesis tyrosine autokinase [Bacteroidota bacterium]